MSDERKAVDIEKLVQWAVREELPKGMSVAASSWQAISAYCALGTRVDTFSWRGGPGDGLGRVPGEPHGDAVIIGRAVRELPSRLSVSEAASAAALFGDDLAGVAFLGMPDVLALSFNPIALIMSCAAQGIRPNWNAGEVRPRKMLTRDGRPVLVGECKASNRYTIGAYCPLAYDDPSAGEIGIARAEWHVWHQALAALRDRLEGELADHRPVGPSAPAEPWRSDAPVEAAPRIVESLVPLRKINAADRPRAGSPLRTPIGKAARHNDNRTLSDYLATAR